MISPGQLHRVAVAVAVTIAVAANPAGAQVYYTAMDGSRENPPVNTPGSGEAWVTVTGSMMRVQAVFQDLIGTTTVAHIHCCVAPPGNVGVATPVPTFPGFPAGVTSGSYDMVFDMALASSYNPAFLNIFGGNVLQARDALFAGFEAGHAYFNIHTTFSPPGEIRGFLAPLPDPVPEPASMILLATGLVGLGALRRRRIRPEQEA